MAADPQVVIVGGGPVGACMANLLAREQGFDAQRILLVEARPPGAPPPGTEIDPRVFAISRATERILRACGAWQRLEPRYLSAYERMCVWDHAASPQGLGAVRFDCADVGEPNLGYIVESRRLQWALFESARARGIAIENAVLQAVVAGSDGVSIALTNGRELRADLVVAADGVDSPTRRALGIGLKEAALGQAVVTHVRTALPHRRTAWQRFLASGPVALLPLHDGRSSVVWSTTAMRAADLVRLSDDEFCSVLEEATDSILGRVEACTTRLEFPLRSGSAEAYTGPGWALVGDAAHSVHPLAGQGVNLGFLDCAALAEILAQARAAGETIDGRPCDHRVLRRYERWRKGENFAMLTALEGLNSLFSNDNSALSLARRAGLAAVDRLSPVKRLFMRRALGLQGDLPRIVRMERTARGGQQ